MLVALSMTTLWSCQDNLEEQFNNPQLYTPKDEQLVSGMFTSALLQYKFYIGDYGEMWWQMSGNGMPSYAQITHRLITSRYAWYIDYDDVVNGNGFDDSGFSWFNDYYVRMRNWPIIQKELATMSGKEYDDNIIYLKLLTITKDWLALRNVDLYNSIPYTEAFKGVQGTFFPKYDNPQDVYKSVLDELEQIAGELPGIYSKMSPAAINLLKTQDIALQGDVTKWAQYANALRLRFAVKLAAVDATFAKRHITSAMANLPKEDLTFVLPHIDAAADLPGGGTWQRGIYETVYSTHIPNVILNRMNFHNAAYEVGIDDPRLPVIAFPTKFNDYRGTSMNVDANDVEFPGATSGQLYFNGATNLEESARLNVKSQYNQVTLTRNNVPADMITLGEIDLILAEIAAKGLASTGKTAGDHIVDEIRHSTDYWYKLNALGQYRKDYTGPWKDLIRPVKPSAANIDLYANNVKLAFNTAGSLDNQMEIIMQQKYIHINILHPYELWGELRRTRHPRLEPMTFHGKVMKPQPERLRYPNSELSNNTDQFLKVSDQNNFTSPIFWRTDGSSYYRNSDITFKTGLLPDFN
ncbi:hypothetical protein FEM08_06190 [Flavobacterium gilvum]|nr:hypothetical protein FEM08_06190 [Flavobacterium gilvum]